jgi:single-strand DNA-binding protein
MPALNKVHLIGNLTRDPELRVTPKGTSICQFGMAMNRQFKDEAGQTRDDATFVDVEAWGKSADNIAKFCTKGKLLYVEGRLKLDQWEDKASGQKRSKIKVVCESFQFLGGKGEDSSSEAAERQSTPPRSGSPKPASTENLDEDVPF